MEKLDVSKYPSFLGNFVPVGEEWAIGGAGDSIKTKSGKTVETFVLVRIKDKLVVRFFADQLRQEGGKLLVNAESLAKQIARAEAFRAGKQPQGQ